MTDYLRNVDNFQQASIHQSRLVAGALPDSQCAIIIAIPTFRRSALLRQTLASIVRQTQSLEEIGVLIVDNDPDGSNAEAAAMVCEFSFPAIAYYRNAQNLGMFGNWNRCIELAPTRWVTILNDDDELLPGFLASILPILNGQSRALVSCDVGLRVEDPTRWQSGAVRTLLIRWKKSFSDGHLSSRTASDYYYTNPHYGSLGIVFETAAGRELGGFNSAWYPTADYIFYTRYAKAFGSRHFHRELASYRVGVNESMKPEVIVKSIRQGLEFRASLATEGFGWPFPRFMAQLEAAVHARQAQEKFNAGFDVACVMLELGLPAYLMAKPVYLVARAFYFFRDIWRILATRCRR